MAQTPDPTSPTSGVTRWREALTEVRHKGSFPVMAEDNPNRVSLRLGAKALLSLFRFSGRSTASEVISFYLLYMVSVVGVMLASIAVPFEWEDSPVFRLAISLLEATFTFPYLALLVRRLHDQERSLRWLWLVPGLLGVTIAMLLLPEGEHSSLSVRLLGWRRHPEWSPVAVLCLLASVASFFTLLTLLLMPGTSGPNRHGPDPRL